MTEPLRWGVLGAAKFAREHMARAIHAAQGAELYALATTSPDKAAGFAAYAPGLKVHASYDDLLADDQVDAVYIPLPNSLHVEWTLKALEAGKHVLCEKPLAMSAAETSSLLATAASAPLTEPSPSASTHKVPAVTAWSSTAWMVAVSTSFQSKSELCLQ